MAVCISTDTRKHLYITNLSAKNEKCCSQIFSLDSAIPARHDLSHNYTSLCTTQSLQLPNKIVNSMPTTYANNDYMVVFMGRSDGQNISALLTNNAKIGEGGCDCITYQWDLPGGCIQAECMAYDKEYGLIVQSSNALASLSFTSDEYVRQTAGWKWQEYGSKSIIHGDGPKLCTMIETKAKRRNLFICNKGESEIFDFECKRWIHYRYHEDAELEKVQQESAICYNNLYQSVYTGGNWNIRSFDLEKQEWWRLSNTRLRHNKATMWFDKYNPNLLFIGSMYNEDSLEYMDLRCDDGWRLVTTTIRTFYVWLSNS